MKFIQLGAVALASLLISSAAMAEEAAGEWHGVLDANGQTFRVALHLQKSAAGYAGTADSLDQGAMGLALTDVASDGQTLSFSVPSVMGTYKAKWDDTQHQWAGQWSQNGMDLPLAFSSGPVPAAQ